MIREWRRIPNFSRYLVSSLGEVARTIAFNLRCDPKPLAVQPRNGYLRVWLLRDDDRRQWRPIHTLVLEAFVGPRPSPKHHGAHGRHGSWCNAVTNLRWALPHENEADKRAMGTHPRGGARVATSERRVRAICRRWRKGESFSSLAREFQMHRSSVARIAKGERRSAV